LKGRATHRFDHFFIVLVIHYQGFLIPVAVLDFTGVTEFAMLIIKS
jgi:hypothetical protein